MPETAEQTPYRNAAKPIAIGVVLLSDEVQGAHPNSSPRPLLDIPAHCHKIPAVVYSVIKAACVR